jgi:hypothetical protein
MKIKKKWIICLMGILLLSFSLYSCDNPADDYKKFVRNKNITYPQMIDSIIGYSGINHATLEIVKPPDPLVSKVGIFWKGGNDSLFTKFQKDTLQVQIDNLKKGSYTFNTYTYNEEGIKSKDKTISVKVFGEDIEKTLKPRKIKYAFYYNGLLSIYWDKVPGSSSLTNLGTKIYYKNETGKNDSLLIKREDNLTILKNYNFGLSNKVFQKETFYKLSPISDIFNTEKENKKVEDIKPISDIIAKIIQKDGNTPWTIPDYGLSDGIKPYNDRDYILTDVGPYKDMEFIRGSNDTKSWPSTKVHKNPAAIIFLRSDIKGPIKFYVAVDHREEKLNKQWVINEGFKKTGNTISVGDLDYNVRVKEFEPGSAIYVGGAGSGHYSTYIYFFKKGQ